MHLHPEALFIVQAIILIGVPFFTWRYHLVRKFVPLVVVQILIGVILGPSVFGKIAPEAFHMLFPKESLPVLNGLAWLAITFFGFLSGLHFDLQDVMGKGKSFLLVSLSTAVIPGILGAIAAYFIYDPALLGENANMTTYILGMGIASGVTALPVLSAILIELKLIDKSFGKKALGYATVNDLSLWLVIAILIAISGPAGSGGFEKVLITLALTFVYLVFMYFLVRPGLNFLHQKNFISNTIDNKELVLVLCMMLVSSLATELIGIHYLLGAFIFGAMVPKAIAHEFNKILEKVVIVILLPFFFMLTGLRTSFEVNSSLVWIVFSVMTVVASIGKIFGTAIAEKLTGSSWKEGFQVSMLMQTRGLMDVVVISIMYTSGILSSIAFSALLFRAIVTTGLAKPSLMLIDKLFEPKEMSVSSKSLHSRGSKLAHAPAKSRTRRNK